MTPYHFTVLLVLTATIARADDMFESIDGTRFAGRIRTIDAGGRITGDRLPEGLKLDDLRFVTPDPGDREQPPATAGPVVQLAGGGRIVAQSVTCDGDHVRIDTVVAGVLLLELEAVAGIRLSADTGGAFARSLAAPSDEFDRFIVRLDGQIELIDGFVEEITAAEVVFERDDKLHRLPRSEFVGVVFAQIEPADGRKYVQLETTDGSLFPATGVTLEEPTVSLPIGESRAAIPWTRVRRLAVHSKRLVFLSDLKPVRAVQQPIVTFPSPARMDRNVRGDTLRLDGQPFAKGIGVHANATLEFDLSAEYALLIARVGIDDGRRGRGDCVASIQLDERTVWSQRLRGGESGAAINLKVDGAKKLTLAVQAGEDLDLSDHVDWCDIRLIK